jgi:recombination protein RecT
MMNNEIAIVDKTLKDVSGQFISTISQYKWDLIPESQLLAAKQALMKSDWIMKIASGNPASVHDAIIKAGILGVDLTEGKRQGYLLPRKNARGKQEIQLQVGYKGVEAIHQRMGVIDRLTVRVVRENDEFEWSGDDAEKPVHNANWFGSDEDRGKISGAFAVTYFPDGKIHVVTAAISQIFEKHRDISDSWKQYKEKTEKGEWAYPPPWVSNEEEMVKKTMAYIASKQWPANIRDAETSSKIIQTLNEVDYSDYTSAFAKYTDEQKKIFYDLKDAGDGLGMYLFGKIVTKEAYIALYNSFPPDGTIMKNKKIVDDLFNMGLEIFGDIVDAIEKEDGLKFLENIEDVCQWTKQALWKSLSKDQQKIATELSNEIVNE